MLTNCIVPQRVREKVEERREDFDNGNCPPLGTCGHINLGVNCSEGVIGSCYLEFGNSKVMCSLVGPRQTQGQGSSVSLEQGSLECEVRFANFLSCREEESSRQAAREKLLSHSVSILLLLLLFCFRL